MIQSQAFTTTFLKKKEEAKDTFSFFFTRPEGFDFVAGQYNRWTLSITATDGRGNSRFITISSSPLEKEYIGFTTKIIQSDFKKALAQLKEHDEIKIFGPMGQFTLDEQDTKGLAADRQEKVFIAGGIGITPFHSIITYAAQNNSTVPITLLASFSIPEEMVFYDELTEIAKSQPTIKVIYTITKPEESQTSWQGERGRVSEALMTKYVNNIPNSVFYVAGPPPMVEGTQKLLEELHVTEENIKVEQFSGY